MTLSEFDIKRCEKLVAEFIERRRPPPRLRKEVDLAFRIKGPSVEIFKIRAQDTKRQVHRIAKATYLKGVVGSVNDQSKRKSHFNIKGTLIMASGDPNSGWSDPIGTFSRLQLAVKILATGDGPRKVRIDEATSALTGLVPGDFPKAMRGKAESVLGVREKVRRDHGSKRVSFPFDQLKPKECTALIQDVLSLYEACLCDMTREIKEIVRPNDE